MPSRRIITNRPCHGSVTSGPRISGRRPCRTGSPSSLRSGRSSRSPFSCGREGLPSRSRWVPVMAPLESRDRAAAKSDLVVERLGHGDHTGRKFLDRLPTNERLSLGGVAPRRPPDPLLPPHAPGDQTGHPPILVDLLVRHLRQALDPYVPDPSQVLTCIGHQARAEQLRYADRSPRLRPDPLNASTVAPFEAQLLRG